MRTFISEYLATVCAMVCAMVCAFAAISFAAISVSAQDAKPDVVDGGTESATDSATETLNSDSPGMKYLEQALDKKMDVSRLTDLDEVARLCEKGIETGLSPGNEKFAKEILSASLYEKAERLADALEKRIGSAGWFQVRAAAIESIDRAIAANPNNAENYLLKARIHAMTLEKKLGLEAATKAVELFGDYPQRRSLALVAQASFTEDLPERLQLLDRAVTDDPGNAQARRERGQARLENDQVAKAMEDFRFLLDKDRQDIEALQLLAQLLVNEEKTEEALELIDRSIEDDPAEVNNYKLRAAVQMAGGDFEAAEKDLDKALEMEPRSASILLSRSRLFELQGDHEQALADVTRALEIEPGTIEAILLRSTIAINAGQFPRAISDLRQVLRRDPKNVLIRLQLADVYFTDGQFDMAIELYDEILEENPTEWDAARRRADAWLSLGKYARAIASYEELLKALPDDDGILNNLSWTLSTAPNDSVRDGARALELAEKACQLTDYKQAHILSTLAAAHAELGDFEKAREWSGKAVELGSGEIKEQLRAELESYQNSEPWREQPLSDSDDESSLAKDLEAGEAQESTDPQEVP